MMNNRAFTESEKRILSILDRLESELNTIKQEQGLIHAIHVNNVDRLEKQITLLKSTIDGLREARNIIY